jgi:hypothetical protein
MEKFYVLKDYAGYCARGNTKDGLDGNCNDLDDPRLMKFDTLKQVRSYKKYKTDTRAQIILVQLIAEETVIE